MSMILKKYSVRLICALLCWALIVAPCFHFTKQSFAASTTKPTTNNDRLYQPADAVVGSAVLESNSDIDQIVPLPLPDTSNGQSADKVVTSFAPPYSNDLVVSAPTKPAAPVVQKPTVVTPPTTVETVPPSDTEKPFGGTAQLFDTYAILPQTDGTGFVYYEQTWDAYKNYPYGSSTVGRAGCGPTSMAMVISNLTGTRVSPKYMADWAYKKGYFVSGRGSSYAIFPAASSMYGIKCSTVSKTDKAAITDALNNGKYLITVVRAGTICKNRHFLMIRGITDDGKLLLADSGSYEHCLTEWDYNAVLKEVDLSYFWVFEK